MNYNPIKGMKWRIKRPLLPEAHWIQSPHFIKCSNCKYEEPIASRFIAPRKCPRCDRFMYNLIKERKIKA